MDPATQRLFLFAQAQPHARSALLLLGLAGFYAHGIHASFWFVIAALGCGYLDWMFSGFLMPRAARTAGWLGVLCAMLAIATLAWGM
jgi:hypothetical protein